VNAHDLSFRQWGSVETLADRLQSEPASAQQISAEFEILDSAYAQFHYRKIDWGQRGNVSRHLQPYNALAPTGAQCLRDLGAEEICMVTGPLGEQAAFPDRLVEHGGHRLVARFDEQVGVERDFEGLSWIPQFGE